MKIIEPSFEYIDRSELTYAELIEKIGRTCYKSENGVKDGSAKLFVSTLVKSKHYAMLEHYWVHFKVPKTTFFKYEVKLLVANYIGEGVYTDIDKYVQVTSTDRGYFISCPIRVFLELDDKLYNGRAGFSFENPKNRMLYESIADLWSLLQFYHTAIPFKCIKGGDVQSNCRCEMYNESLFIEHLKQALLEKEYRTEAIRHMVLRHEIMKHKIHTYRIVCDRGVSHELVRHRPCSFAQESTRYCNYTKDKFGNEITVIKPYFFNRQPNTDKGVHYDDSNYTDWLRACEMCEKMYFSLIEHGATPQEARTVLPNSLKTELIVTANEAEWQHIVDLRAIGYTGNPHPQMREIMMPLYHDIREKSEGRIE